MRKGFILFTASWVMAVLGILTMNLFMLLEIYEESARTRQIVNILKTEAIIKEGLTKGIFKLNEKVAQGEIITDKTLNELKASIEQFTGNISLITEIEDESSKLNLNTMSYALPYLLKQTGFKDDEIEEKVNILGEMQGMEKSFTREGITYYYRPDVLFIYEPGPQATYSFDTRRLPDFFPLSKCASDISNGYGPLTGNEIQYKINMVSPLQTTAKKGKYYEIIGYKKECTGGYQDVFVCDESEKRCVQRGKCLKWGRSKKIQGKWVCGDYPTGGLCCMEVECFEWGDFCIKGHYENQCMKYEDVPVHEMKEMEIARKRQLDIEAEEEITNIWRLAGEKEQENLKKYFTTQPIFGLNINTCDEKILQVFMKWHYDASLSAGKIEDGIFKPILQPRFYIDGEFQNTLDSSFVKSKRPYKTEDLIQVLSSLKLMGQDFTLQGPAIYVADSEYYTFILTGKHFGTQVKIRITLRILPNRPYLLLGYEWKRK